MDHLVFVYGSLKNGFHNHYLLGHSELLGAAVTEPAYTMLSLGGFPGVILDGNTPIKGEVYNVDRSVSKQLDVLEGYPSFYNKTEVDTPFGPAVMYVLNQLSPHGAQYTPERYRVVPDGDWTKDEAFHRAA